ncbi:MAG: endonuclease/exonuclease/phosphatase family protein [Sphingobium sp.]
MRCHIRYALLVLLANAASGIVPAADAGPLVAAHHGGTWERADSAPVTELSVLTYNVKGLPWPVATGRDAAIAAIAERLREERARGRQPRIVILQEAFGDTARQIADRAGYAYVVLGPDAEQAASFRFVKDLPRDWTRGEAIGKGLDSGLAVLSDFPIVGTETMAFGDQACAGFDCLANKGVLKADIHIPGQARPVQLFNTHLNARKASGVSVDKANRAFDRQLALVGRFIQSRLDPSSPTIIAGDFNIGQDGRRRAAFAGLTASGMLPGYVSLEKTQGVRALRLGLVPGRDQRDMTAIVRRSKDLIFSCAMLRPVAASVPFGEEPGEAPLSDHFGYRIDYRLPPLGEGPVRLAAFTPSRFESKGRQQ